MNLSEDTLKFLTDGAPIGERNSKLFLVGMDFCKCGYSRGKAEWDLFYICKKMKISYQELDNVLYHAYYIKENREVS